MYYYIFFSGSERHFLFFFFFFNDTATTEIYTLSLHDALPISPGVKTVIVLKRTGQPVEMQSGRDVWWDDFVKGVPARCPAEPMDSEDLLYLLYTSEIGRAHV